MTLSSLASGKFARPTRTLVVSDVLLYRDGLAVTLGALDAVAIVGAVGGAAVDETIARTRPDVLLLDASLADGLRLARRVAGANPRLKIIGFGVGNADAEVLACAEAGLAGFVGRDGGVGALSAAIGHAMRGEIECSPRLAALLCARIAALADRRAPAEVALTRREREIAALVADGLSNKEIAGELNSGLATIKNHVHNILSKSGLRRRAAIGQLVATAPAVGSDGRSLPASTAAQILS